MGKVQLFVGLKKKKANRNLFGWIEVCWKTVRRNDEPFKGVRDIIEANGWEIMLTISILCSLLMAMIICEIFSTLESLDLYWQYTFVWFDLVWERQAEWTNVWLYTQQTHCNRNKQTSLRISLSLYLLTQPEQLKCLKFLLHLLSSVTFERLATLCVCVPSIIITTIITITKLWMRRDGLIVIDCWPPNWIMI